MFPDSRSSASELDALCALAHECGRRGWVPATSGNFSLRLSDTGRVLISRSGVDKRELRPADLLELDSDGRLLHGRSKPSAETNLHLVIYGARPEAHAIAHVHTVWNTLLSQRYTDAQFVEITGYELLKGLSGVVSHSHRERIPVIANSQDYHTLARELEEALDENPLAHGVLLSAHGLYTWGTTVAEARRHLESLEFLFEVECRRRMAQPLG